MKISIRELLPRQELFRRASKEQLEEALLDVFAKVAFLEREFKLRKIEPSKETLDKIRLIEKNSENF